MSIRTSSPFASSLLCLFAIPLLAAPVATFASDPPKADSPEVARIRRSLHAFPDRVRSLKLFAEAQYWCETLDASAKGRPYGINYELTLDGKKLYHRMLRLPDTGEDELYVTDGKVCKLWLRTGRGPGFGKIRKADAMELLSMRSRFCTWVYMEAYFRFDPEKSPFTITGSVKHRDLPAIAIAWKDGSAECVAYLSTNHGYLPVMLQRKAPRGDVRIDVLAVKPAGPDAGMPSEIEVRTIRKSSRNMLVNKDSWPPGAPDEAEVAWLEHIRMTRLEINVPIKADCFEMPWAHGAEVLDYIQKTRTYWGIQTEKLDELP